MRGLAVDLFGGAGAMSIPVWMVLDSLGIGSVWVIAAGGICMAIALILEGK